MRKQNPKILVIDDDPNMFNLIKIYLSSENYRIDSAKNGRQALRLLESDTFDLILSDILMPEMNGITFVKELKKNKKSDAIIIIVTAHGLEEHFMKAITGGVYDILQKPFTANRLKLTIRNALDFKFLRDDYYQLKQS
jgi:DNA-binding NtrC family response regulator